ncbi:MAG: hypothetical protein GXY41_08970 [Phycisphaerae bacterium]|nr:hypothetical protein [Phycisphaerae bacterium]
MKTTPQIACYHCRFFAAAGNGRVADNPTCNKEPNRQGDSGFCHRAAPQHGRALEQPNGDRVIGFAEWPKVFTHDWCGEFEPRTAFHCPDGCPCNPSCSPKINDLCKNQRPEHN